MIDVDPGDCGRFDVAALYVDTARGPYPRIPGAAGLPGPAEGRDHLDGYTIEVDQCDWGHPCRKRTWLYVCGVEPADLPPVPPPGEHSHVMVRLLRNGDDLPELPKRYRHLTPGAFSVWLCRVAASAGVVRV